MEKREKYKREGAILNINKGHPAGEEYRICKIVCRK